MTDPNFPVVATEEHGLFGYASGTGATTVDVPTGARLKRVLVRAGSGNAVTVTIGGGNTITVPVSTAFEETIPGKTAGDVVIAGTPANYFVSWVV